MSEVEFSCEEGYLSLSIESGQISIETDGAVLTTDQARALAELLVEKADLADQIEGRS